MNFSSHHPNLLLSKFTAFARTFGGRVKTGPNRAGCRAGGISSVKSEPVTHKTKRVFFEMP